MPEQALHARCVRTAPNSFARLTLQQPSAVLGKRRVVPDSVVDAGADEPANNRSKSSRSITAIPNARIRTPAAAWREAASPARIRAVVMRRATSSSKTPYGRSAAAGSRVPPPVPRSTSTPMRRRSSTFRWHDFRDDAVENIGWDDDTPSES